MDCQQIGLVKYIEQKKKIFLKNYKKTQVTYMFWCVFYSLLGVFVVGVVQPLHF